MSDTTVIESVAPRNKGGRPRKNAVRLAAEPQSPAEPSQEAAPPRHRPVRKPFGNQVQKLAYAERPNYHRHWFNDSPGRIVRAQEAGYSHVTDQDGKHVKMVVGTAEGGAALLAFLMEIPQDWYDEDMRAQQVQVDKVDADIRRGVPQANIEDRQAFYPGAQGRKISISQSR